MLIRNLIAAVCFIAILSGCSHIQVNHKDGKLDSVQSFKTPLMGDLNYEEEITTTNPKTGEINTKRVKASTSTNADKVIRAVTEQVGTLVNAAEKAGAALP